jgi:lycopene cyclase domain-containing protein
VTYLLLLGACVVVTLPLELVLRTRVYRRPRRLLLTLLPVFAVFVTWDAIAVHAHQWRYRHLVGARILGLPVEELLFFLVIPTCSILTLQAVRRRRPHWLDDADDR